MCYLTKESYSKVKNSLDDKRKQICVLHKSRKINIKIPLNINTKGSEMKPNVPGKDTQADQHLGEVKFL